MTNKDESTAPGNRADIEKSTASDDRPQRSSNGLVRHVGKFIRESGLTLNINLTLPPKP